MKFINEKDPITLESFDEIPKQNLIKLTVGNKLRFYNIRSLYKWVQIEPFEPETKIFFSKFQLIKIRKCYTKSTYQYTDDRFIQYVKKIKPNYIHSDKTKKVLAHINDIINKDKYNLSKIDDNFIKTMFTEYNILSIKPNIIKLSKELNLKIDINIIDKVLSDLKNGYYKDFLNIMNIFTTTEI